MAMIEVKYTVNNIAATMPLARLIALQNDLRLVAQAGTLFAKLFMTLNRRVMLDPQEGGLDPDSYHRLRGLVEKAEQRLDRRKAKLDDHRK